MNPSERHKKGLYWGISYEEWHQQFKEISENPSLSSKAKGDVPYLEELMHKKCEKERRKFERGN